MVEEEKSKKLENINKILESFKQLSKSVLQNVDATIESLKEKVVNKELALDTIKKRIQEVTTLKEELDDNINKLEVSIGSTSKTSATINVGGKDYSLYGDLRAKQLVLFRANQIQYETRLEKLQGMAEKFERDKRIDQTHALVNQINGKLIKAQPTGTSNPTVHTSNVYNQINDAKNNNLINSLFNSVIGKVYMDWLGFEKGILTSALSGLTKAKDVASNAENTKGILEKIKSGFGDDGILEQVLEELGTIYATFMVLLKNLLKKHGGDIEQLAYERAFDIAGSATDGIVKGGMHALGQIPPFGIIFSVLSLIDGMITTLAKSASTGMMVIDPLLDIFNASTGYDCSEFKTMTKNIRTIKDLLFSGTSPNTGLLMNSAYVDDCETTK